MWQPVAGLRGGKGGQGVVQAVECLFTGKRGALKTLHPEQAKKSERRARMRKEAIGLRKTSGPGIPRVLDANTQTAGESDELYIVMEWIDGQTLDRVVNGKPLSVDRALDYAQQLTRVVLRCHAEGVLHRDIKPSNVVVDAEGVLHLVDFGIAWLPDADRLGHDEYTKTDQEIGNRFLRLYELAGGHERADRRSDVTFIVGVLFYMLSAKQPSKLGHGGNAAPPHVALRDAFPPQTVADPRFRRLERIFDVGFQLAPNDRFVSAAELLARLEQVIEPRPAADDHAAVFQAFNEFVKRPNVGPQHQRMLELKEAAFAFQRRLYDLGAARHVTVMMLTQPERQGDAWTSPIRFEHATLGFKVEAEHVVALEDSEVVCSSGLKGEVKEYYRDRAADIKGLNEVVLGEAERLLAAALQQHLRAQDLIDELFD